jgi:hypothetical protein
LEESKAMKKTYIEQDRIPKKICQNCLNRLHKACSARFLNASKSCECASKFFHDDSGWQLTKTQYNKLHRIKKEKKSKTGKQIESSINKRLDKICQELCRYIIKERAGWKCQLAGKDSIRCSTGNPKEIMQWAHIITRGASKALKFDLQNALCLCSGHHKYYTHRPERWFSIIQSFYPELWMHCSKLKWLDIPTPFSYVDTIKHLTEEASKISKGIKL